MKHTRKRKIRHQKTQKRRLYGGRPKRPQGPAVKPSVSSKAVSQPPAPAVAVPYNMNEMTRQFIAAFEAMMKENPLPVMEKIQENAVAIDCEMVKVGSKFILAQVAIVDFDGNILLNKYVLPEGGIGSITNYVTNKSGVTENHLTGLNEKTHSFNFVKAEVEAILDGKLIVGHGLDNDFKVLNYIPNPELVWDTTKEKKYQKFLFTNKLGQNRFGARSLKNITKEFVGNNIQVEGKPHHPVEDAMASMNLYRVSLGFSKLPIPSY